MTRNLEAENARLREALKQAQKIVHDLRDDPDMPWALMRAEENIASLSPPSASDTYGGVPMYESDLPPIVQDESKFITQFTGVVWTKP